MIYCSKCGTANRRGSRFCNECGELLPTHTTLRCPMCGATNPVGNAYCDRCNARITPMATEPSEEAEHEPSPIKGLSLPSIPLGEEKREQPVDETVQNDEVEEQGDWLAQLRASTAGEGMIEEVGAEEEETEDWLAQLRASTAGEIGASEAALEPVEPVELPDWLRGLGPIGAEAEPLPAEEPTAAKTPWEAAESAHEQAAPALPEAPDWLREIALPEPALNEVEEAAAAPPAAGPAFEEATPAPAEIPDWLREIVPPELALGEAEGAAAAQAAPPAAEPAFEEAAPVPAEIPDWLREIVPPELALGEAEGAATPQAAPPAAEPVFEEAAPAPAEIPDWLREITPAEAALSEVKGAAAPEAAPPVAGSVFEKEIPVPAEIPDWLRELAAPETPVPSSTPSPSAVPPLMEFPTKVETSESPAWLSELEKEAAPPPVSKTPVFEGAPPPVTGWPETKTAEAEGLARAEIPGWLEAMRPREAAGPAAQEEPLETEGLLEGLRGVLTPTSVIEMPSVREAAPPAAASEAILARAQLLQSLLARQVEAPKLEVRKREVSATERIQRWVVTLAFLVIAAVLIAQSPLVGISLPEFLQAHPIDSAGVDRLVDTVQNVSADTTVLVAFEYGPMEADELDLVAEPIVQHLSERGALLAIASTRPEGIVMAARLMGSRSYVNTPGYMPGGDAGVAQLLTGVGTRPGLILVLTAQPGPLRWWVEQTRAVYGDGAPPIVAGVSAALEPAASPYLDVRAGQLQGVASGLSGAAAYEARRGTTGKATERFTALAVGQVTIVALMVVGAIIYAFGGSRRRKT